MVSEMEWPFRNHPEYELVAHAGWPADRGDVRSRVGEDVLMPRLVTLTAIGRGLPVVEAEVVVGDDGVPRCRSVRVASEGPARDVQTSDLSAISVDALVEMVAGLLGSTDDEDPAVWADGRGPDAVREHRVIRAVRAARSDARRRKVTPELLKKVAAVYQANPDAPTRAVQAAFPDIAHRTAGLYVRRARDAGLLPQLQEKDGPA